MVVLTSWGKVGNQDHEVGAGLSTVFIFDVSGWIVVDRQVGGRYAFPFLHFLLKTVKDGEWMHIEVRLPPVHFYLLKSSAFFTSFFSLCHFQCLLATSCIKKTRREREEGGDHRSRETHLRDIDQENTFPHLNLLRNEKWVITMPLMHSHLLLFLFDSDMFICAQAFGSHLWV